MINWNVAGLRVRCLAVLFLGCSFAGNANAHSFEMCVLISSKVCFDIYPPSMYDACVIGVMASCGSHKHGEGGFAPVELPFGARTFPGLDKVLEDDEISPEFKAMAREALEAHRLREEVRAREFNMILRARALAGENLDTCGEYEDTKD